MNTSKTSLKILLTLVAISGTIWLGSHTIKLFSYFNLFNLNDEGNLILKDFYNTKNIFETIYALLPVMITSIISYIVFILTSVLYVFISKMRLKENGWLLISMLIIAFMLPLEIILLLKDYKLIQMIYENSQQSNEMIEILRLRVSEFSSFPIVSLILYFSIIALIVFKPLTKKNYEN